MLIVGLVPTVAGAVEPSGKGNWVHRTPTTSPSARSGPSMVYDAAIGEVVLFGGYNSGGLNDTWTYDGSEWTQLVAHHQPARPLRRLDGL